MLDPNQQLSASPLAGNAAPTAEPSASSIGPDPSSGTPTPQSQTGQPAVSAGISASEPAPGPSTVEFRTPVGNPLPTNAVPSASQSAETFPASATSASESSPQVISIQPHLTPAFTPSAELPPVTGPVPPLPVRTPGSTGLDGPPADNAGPSILKIDENVPAPAATEAPATIPTPDTPAIKVVAALLKTSHLLRAFLADHFAEFGLSDIRYTVMRRIDQSGDQGCSQAELARELNQSESSISTLIDRMRNDGLIYRLRSQNDRRKRVLLLSDEGRQRFARARACHGERMAQLLGGLDEGQVRILQTSLDVLAEELAETKQTETVRAAA